MGAPHCRRMRAAESQDAAAAVAAAQASLAEQEPVDGIISSQHCDDPDAYVCEWRSGLLQVVAAA